MGRLRGAFNAALVRMAEFIVTGEYLAKYRGSVQRRQLMKIREVI